jgi:hypothetical protein
MSIIIKAMKKKLLLIPMLLTLSFLYSQEMKLYAPFPSRITTETSGENILLTWKDAKDISEGSYEIYRSEKAITADNLNLAEKIGQVPSDTQLFTDTPPIGEDYYYAVFANDSTRTYKICIPYRNVTTSAIRISESDIEETKSTMISRFSAQSIDTEVQLNFLSSLINRKILIFRSTSPIENYENLLKSVNVAEVSGSEIHYTDNPIAGIDYYYAAVDGELYRSGSMKLLYEGNYTREKVQVKFSHEVERDEQYVKSLMPLPLLKIASDLESGLLIKELAAPQIRGTISDENILSINRLIGPDDYPVYEKMTPELLGYNKNINSIISTYFLNKRWEDTVNSLENYTSLNFDSETRKQSHFYRGQSYFFMGRYNKALLEFIMIKKDLFAETEPWFDAIYSLLKG